MRVSNVLISNDGKKKLVGQMIKSSELMSQVLIRS